MHSTLLGLVLYKNMRDPVLTSYTNAWDWGWGYEPQEKCPYNHRHN